MEKSEFIFYFTKWTLNVVELSTTVGQIIKFGLIANFKLYNRRL